MRKRSSLLIFATLVMSGVAFLAYQKFLVFCKNNSQTKIDSNLAFEAGKEKPEGRQEDIPLSFTSYQEMMRYHSQIEVAGYGSSTGGFGEMTTLGQFTFFSAEIPGEQKFQVFVYGREQEPTPYFFVDNFILSGNHPPLLTFATDGDDLIFIHEITGEMIKRKKIDLQ